MQAQISKWANGDGAAWRLLAEAHALAILTTETFLYPREAGDGACNSQGSIVVFLPTSASNISVGAIGT